MSASGPSGPLVFKVTQEFFLIHVSYNFSILLNEWKQGWYHGPRGENRTDQFEPQPRSKFWQILSRGGLLESESFLTKDVGVVFTFSPLLITSLNSLNTNKSCFHNYKASFSLKKSRNLSSATFSSLE